MPAPKDTKAEEVGAMSEHMKEIEKKKQDPKVQELIKLDEEYMTLEQEFQKKFVELQAEYEKKQQPMLEKRAEVLEQGTKGDSATPAVPGFWLEVLQNHLAFQEDVQEWDEEVLHHLKNITTDDLPDESGLNKKGFSVTFHFEENDFFTNETLTREFHTTEESPYLTEINCFKIAQAEEIQWKAGKDVTIEFKKPKGKKGKSAKPKKEARDSFFRKFFRTIDTEEGEPEDLEDLVNKVFEEMGFDPKEVENEEEMDEAYEQAMERVIDEAYEQGIQLKDAIVPFAVRFYTGEAVPVDEDEDDEEFDEDEDDEEDSEEDSEDDDSEEEGAEKKETKKADPNLFKATGAAEEKVNTEECKQQ